MVPIYSSMTGKGSARDRRPSRVSCRSWMMDRLAAVLLTNLPCFRPWRPIKEVLMGLARVTINSSLTVSMYPKSSKRTWRSYRSAWNMCARPRRLMLYAIMRSTWASKTILVIAEPTCSTSLMICKRTRHPSRRQSSTISLIMTMSRRCSVARSFSYTRPVRQILGSC